MNPRFLQIYPADNKEEIPVRIALFNPRYPYGKSRTYLCGGLMNLGSRLLTAGMEVSFTDLNHATFESREDLDHADTIGFTVLGPPYIPEVVRNIEELRAIGYCQPIIVGGEGVARLQEIDFKAWFGCNNGVRQVKNDGDLAEAFGVQIGMKPIPSAFETSMVRMLTRLSREQLARYLRREFSLFMSNGCMFNCNFCEAAKGQPEKYRTVASLEDEIDFITRYLASVGHPFLDAYVSNLDMFQNPEQLEERFAVVHRICEERGIVPRLRGLATSKCTVVSCREDSDLPRRLRHHGLQTVGFGADGASELTWRRENKRHNSIREIEEAIRMMSGAGISTELLMVLGFQGSKAREIFASLELSFRLALHGVVNRPYLAKSQTPGNGHWTDGDPQVERFRNDASLLKRLDYAMLGSGETHPKRTERWLANAAYLTLIGTLAPFGLCLTRPLVPVPARGYFRKIAQAINRRMPVDR
jgi:hypothetical protein